MTKYSYTSFLTPGKSALMNLADTYRSQTRLIKIFFFAFSLFSLIISMYSTVTGFLVILGNLIYTLPVLIVLKNEEKNKKQTNVIQILNQIYNYELLKIGLVFVLFILVFSFLSSRSGFILLLSFAVSQMLMMCCNTFLCILKSEQKYGQ